MASYFALRIQSSVRFLRNPRKGCSSCGQKFLVGCCLVLAFITFTGAGKVAVDSRGSTSDADRAQTSKHVASHRGFNRSALLAMRKQSKLANRGRYGFFLHQDYFGIPSSVGPDASWANVRSVQTFLNVLARGSYVMPHMHPQKGKWEVFVRIDGDFQVGAFDHDIVSNDLSNLAETVTLCDDVPLVVVSEGTFHAIAALDEGGSVEFEVKPGPYLGMPADKVMSHQLATPWGFDEKSEAVQNELPKFVERLEKGKGYRAWDPLSQLSNYSRLTPYSRLQLLEHFKSGATHLMLSNDKTIGAPLLNIIYLPGAIDSNELLPPPTAKGSAWSIYIWLAGGSVQIGGKNGFILGRAAPMVEIWGIEKQAASSMGLAAVTAEATILLEVSEVS